MPHFNPLVEKLSSPPVPSVLAWAKSYDGSRGPLIDLSQAVPGYPAHPDMLAWLGEAAASTAYTGYGAIEGEAALREAYAAHVAGLYRAAITADNIHITSGCNQAFICTAMAIASAGDTILMTNPYYFNQETTLAMLGINVELVPCDAGAGFLRRSTQSLLRCGRVSGRSRWYRRTIRPARSIRPSFCRASTKFAAPTAPG